MDTEATLRAIVEILATPRGRMVGSAAHDAARDVLFDQLQAVGAEPYAGDAFALGYSVRGMDFTNLVGVVPGEDRARAPVLLGAHYDTAGVQAGADDNAAAVAIVLEVARRLREGPAQRDVIVALFDAEEPPHYHTPAMGSTYFASHQMREPVHAAIVLDLVGHEVPLPGAGDLLFVTGMESDPQLERTIQGLPEEAGLRVVTALNRYVGDVSDHRAFRLGRTPYLFLTCGRWDHYHQVSDTPDRLAYGKMTAVARTTEAMTRDVATRSLDGPWEGYDTTETDLALLRAGLGHLAARAGVALRDRGDIERLVTMLIGRLGI